MQSCWFSFCNKWRNLKSLNCVVEFGKTWLNCIMTTSTVPKMKTNEATCHPQLQHSSYDVAMFCKSKVEKYWLLFDIAETIIRWHNLISKCITCDKITDTHPRTSPWSIYDVSRACVTTTSQETIQWAEFLLRERVQVEAADALLVFQVSQRVDFLLQSVTQLVNGVIELVVVWKRQS